MKLELLCPPVLRRDYSISSASTAAAAIVGLVDALGVPDYLLHSALGRADGDVYQALLDMAQVSPLNATEEGPAWHSILKPVMLANKGKPAGGSPLAKL
ncbi:acyl-coenzyme A oxidase [Haematococcus lacustris]|uniref:Acyl-coenzyme A oxidase n=1 Tax=Haematococcus lacustris TaxID=44745 RepID=A0A6A0AEQ2_HAELA|nr:acyl-coenzyme A oxidase [Haematococcus lacustris]